MLKVVGQSLLDNYLTEDWVFERINKRDGLLDRLNFTGDRWLLDSPAKRMIYSEMYGSFFEEGVERESAILDVGGGYCSLSTELAKKINYTLLDICAHETEDQIRYIEGLLGRQNFVQDDWHHFFSTNKKSYDIIIANDLFPNVDQRLDLFLKHALPRCRELRLSLTFYNNPRFYQVKRVNADETLWYLAWDYSLLRTILSPYRQRMEGDLDEAVGKMGISLYPNGRQVVVTTMRGDLS